MSRRSLVPLTIAALFFIGSGAAVATGLFSEVYRTGNVFAAASRPVSLAEARLTGVPLPGSDSLPGGWKLMDVQLTKTAEWSSVGLQYDRDGQRGMNVTVWSAGIHVFDPTRRDLYDEALTVSGVPIYVISGEDSVTSQTNIRAFFLHRGAAVEIFAFGPAIAGRSFGSGELAILAEAWMSQAR